MMMKRSISLVTALCLLSLCACAAPGGRAVSPASADGEMGSSVSFTDSLGSTITLEEAPHRQLRGDLGPGRRGGHAGSGDPGRLR